MAVTRKMLKAMGIEDDKIDQIIEAHTEVVDGLKAYKADAERLTEVQKELDTLKAKSGEDWKSKYDTLKQTFDDYKTETANREKTEKVKAAYVQLLKDSKVDEKRIDAILKITDLSDKALDENGKFADAEEMVKSIKSEWGAFIQQTGTQGAKVETPPDNPGKVTMSRAEIYAKDEKGRYKLSTSERQKAIAESLNNGAN